MQANTVFRVGSYLTVTAALGMLTLGCSGSKKSDSPPATTEPGTSVYLQDSSAQPQEEQVSITIDEASVNTDQGPVPLTLATPEGQASKTLNLSDTRANSALIAMGDDISGATAESVTLTVIRAETTNPTTGVAQQLTLEQTEVTVPLTSPTTLETSNTIVVDLRPEIQNGAIRLVPGDTSITTATPTPTTANPTTAPTPINTNSNPPANAPATVVLMDDEAESPYSPTNLNNAGNLRIADMETVKGSSNWIICENRPPLETVGPEDTQYTADGGLVYDGGTFDNPTGAPGNGAGVPTGAVLGTVDDFMRTLTTPAQP